MEQLFDENRDKLNLIQERLGLEDLSRVTWKMFSKASDDFLAEYSHIHGNKDLSYKYLLDISQDIIAKDTFNDKVRSKLSISDKERNSEAYKSLISLYRDGCIKHRVENLLPGIGLSQVRTESCADLTQYIQDQSEKTYGRESLLHQRTVELSLGFTVKHVSDDQIIEVEELKPAILDWKSEWHLNKEGELLNIDLSKVSPRMLKDIHKQILDSYKGSLYEYAVDISQGGVSNLVKDIERESEAYKDVLNKFRDEVKEKSKDSFIKFLKRKKMNHKHDQ